MLHSVENELNALAHGTAELASAISMSLRGISGADMGRDAAIASILIALERVQDVESRFNGLALAIRQYALLRPGTSNEVFAQIWQSAGLGDTSTVTRGRVSARTVDLDELSFSVPSDMAFVRSGLA